MKWFLSFSLLFISTWAMLKLPFFNEPIKDPVKAMHMVDEFFEKNISSLPRYAEAGYSPLGRSPVVDILLEDPLYAPTYARTVTKLIKDNSSNNSIYTLASSLFKAAGMPIEEKIFKNSNTNTPDIFVKTFDYEIAKKLFGYWTQFLEIKKEVDEVLKELSLDEKKWLKENYQKFFLGENSKDFDFFTTESIYPLKFFALAAKVDFAKLNDSARRLSLLVEDFYQNKDSFSFIQLTNDFIYEEQGLKFIISSKSHVTHIENADFFIDLGGYNFIETNAGSADGNRSLALHIDLNGHNFFQGKNFVQGCGFLGVGMLASFAGNNQFHADSYAQGCGFFGTGFLVNFKGNNHFTMNFAGQSFASFGSSLLYNKEGKNQYLASDGMAQGVTSTLGVAFLIENQGDNYFVGGEIGKKRGGIGQGGSTGVRFYPWLNNPSFYGGLSFLYLGGGNNKLKNIWLSQGSAYFLGAGIVVAEGDNDLFEADYDAQGQGLHLAAGVLLKKGDNGKFNGGWGSIGVSGDRSIGIFIGIGKNNSFEGTDQSIGTSRKPKSLGVFINIGGENSYKFQKQSNARLQFPQYPKEWSSALFLEIGKGSTFIENVDEFTRGPDLEWGIKDHSLGLSIASIDKESEKLIFNKFHQKPKSLNLFDPINGWEGNTSYQKLVGKVVDRQQLADEIMTAGYDRRRQIYETLDLWRYQDRKQEYDLSHLLQKGPFIPTDAFNYAVLWALRNKDKVDLTNIKTALKEKAFKDEYARKMAVSLVGTFWSKDTLAVLKDVMLNDPIEEIRYYAALSITINLSDDSLDTLKKGLKNPSEWVRYAIAKGLQESSYPKALEIVTPLLNDESFYVRRAAGITALSLGDKKGIPVVLDTLQYDTLDTEDNYGDNIYRQLSNYLNVDFGLDKNAWIEWWNQTKDNG